MRVPGQVPLETKYYLYRLHKRYTYFLYILEGLCKQVDANQTQTKATACRVFAEAMVEGKERREKEGPIDGGRERGGRADVFQWTVRGSSRSGRG